MTVPPEKEKSGGRSPRSALWNMNDIVGSHDILFVVIDSLRYDVAAREFAAGRTPNLERLFSAGWEERHTPGSFTYAALHAFFAGFLPTPAIPGGSRERRLFAVRFAGSETIGPETKVFEEETIVGGLRSAGYRSVCIGGVGFFNEKTSLSRVFPRLFCESHWRSEFEVTNRNSTEHQFRCAKEAMARIPVSQPLFLFLNLSAVHQPNYFYARENGPDDLESHAAALRYIDSQVPLLIHGFGSRIRPLFAIFCSDHGTAYGEDGYAGHRLAHPVVWTVPYADGICAPAEYTR